MIRSVAILIGFAGCSLLINAGPVSAQESAKCPFPWLLGEFRYIESTGDNGTVSFTRIDDNAIQGSWMSDAGHPASEVAGWQPANQQLVIAGFASDGGYWHLKASDVHDSGFSGHGVFGKRDGSKNEGTFTLTRKSDDLATTQFKGKDLSGNEVGFEGRFERINKTSTMADFREFVDLMVGRWSGEITLVTDWPGMEKKRGEKLMRYHSRQRVADDAGFITTIVGGAVTGCDIGYYDAASKRIKVTSINSAGGSSDITIWKKSDHEWGFTAKGCLHDGRKTLANGVLTSSDDGRTLTFAGDFDIEGQESDPLMDVWRRLD